MDAQLDKSAKKWLCPQCQKRRFVRFVDESGSYLPEQFGRCDREQNCGYYMHPAWNRERIATTQPIAPAQLETRYVPHELMKKTLSHYLSNNFVLWLSSVVGMDLAMQAVLRYFIGTAKGAGTIFWQIDHRGRVRTGQKIHYGFDGHRDKKIEPKRLFIVAMGYQPCLFGEHLLASAKPDELIGIVESEKTAVIASIYYPHLNQQRCHWLASCAADGLTEEKAKVLASRQVVLCPDFSFSARAKWGLLPMRRKYVELVEIGRRRVIAEDGELVPDYVSLKDRLVQIGCTVSFLDPFPKMKDGSDIADYLVEIPAPIWDRCNGRWVELCEEGYPKCWDAVA